MIVPIIIRSSNTLYAIEYHYPPPFALHLHQQVVMILNLLRCALHPSQETLSFRSLLDKHRAM